MDDIFDIIEEVIEGAGDEVKDASAGRDIHSYSAAVNRNRDNVDAWLTAFKNLHPDFISYGEAYDRLSNIPFYIQPTPSMTVSAVSGANSLTDTIEEIQASICYLERRIALLESNYENLRTKIIALESR